MRHYYRNVSKTALALITTIILTAAFTTANAQPNGEELFNQNCASCHFPHKDMTGPALKGAQARWLKETGDSTMIYKWVKNSAGLISKGVPYAVQLKQKWNENMQSFSLSNEEIDAIFSYVEGYDPPVTAGTGDEAGATGAGEEEEGISYWWYVVGSALLIIMGAAASVRRQLVNANRVQEGKDPLPDESYGQIFRKWAWKNFNYALIGGLVVLFVLLIGGYKWLMGVGVYDQYQPSQPVAGFSHQIHASKYEIDCEYCHNSASKSKHAGLPTVNVCMNCHKQIDGKSEEGKRGIATVREAAGYDVENKMYTGNTKPIVWNRVYVLPDHVYFNHKQHVKVAGLKCQNCHGPVETMTTAMVSPVSQNNKVEDAIQLTKPTLTMGWCIECHENAQVQLESSGGYYEEIHRRLKKRPELLKKYLDDELITVKELGGWECSKCHY